MLPICKMCTKMILQIRLTKSERSLGIILVISTSINQHLYQFNITVNYEIKNGGILGSNEGEKGKGLK